MDDLEEEPDRGEQAEEADETIDPAEALAGLAAAPEGENGALAPSDETFAKMV